jgi:hypothetical protein
MNVPGRPPGMELKFAVGGRAAASSLIQSSFDQKERIMKTTIITMILAVGILLRPQPKSTPDQALIADNATVAGTMQHSGPQLLKTSEMNAAVGGDQLTGCYLTKAENGDTYATCCLDLWIFSVCLGVNWSALDRFVSTLI